MTTNRVNWYEPKKKKFREKPENLELLEYTVSTGDVERGTVLDPDPGGQK
jgi:hypothetical protein